MSRRSQLEHEVSVAQERIKKAAKDTPKDIIKLWEQDLVDLELELNNYKRQNKLFHFQKTFCSRFTFINTKQNVHFTTKK